jgi:hypothetical protein
MYSGVFVYVDVKTFCPVMEYISTCKGVVCIKPVLIEKASEVGLGYTVAPIQ